MKSKSTVIHLAMLNDLFLHTGGGGALVRQYPQPPSLPTLCTGKELKSDGHI